MPTDTPFNDAHPQLASLLRYLLLGASTFGALRLGSDINLARQLNNEKAKDKSTLVIDLPENRNPYLTQQKQAIEKASWDLELLKKLLNAYVMPAAAAGTGFVGTKALYDVYQKHKLKKEIESANTKYLESLANFKQASEHVATPNVDNFCEAVANTLQKQASWKLPESLFNPALTKTSENEALQDAVANQQRVSANLSNHRLGWGDIPGAGLAGDSFKAGLGTVGLMGLYMLIKAHMKRQEKEQKRTLPSSVAINYKPVNV